MYFHYNNCYQLVYKLLFALFIIMCLHHVSRGLDKLDREIHSIDELLDDFDTCDYVSDKFSSNGGDLCVVQLNIRGISSKQSQLKYLIDNCLENRTPDIIIVCETWLTPFSPQIHIPGYDFCHKDQITKCGGGVALLISNRIRYKVLEDIRSKLPKPTFECLTAEISLLNGQKLVVNSIYQPLNTHENDFVDQYSNFICNLKKGIKMAS